MGERIHLAANNPDLGGGEQMLLRHAEALLSLGRPVTVVAPDSPSEVLDAASALGADVVAIRADGRRDYVRRLRAWDRAERRGVLWCHGLVPAFATTGRPDRIVHLHQEPRSRAQRIAADLARRGTRATLVPSADASARIPGSRAHANWTTELPRQENLQAERTQDVGYLGRLSTDKGVDVLARAMGRIGAESRLLLAGDTRYVARESVATVDAAISEARSARGPSRSRPAGRACSVAHEWWSSRACGRSPSASSSPRPWRPASPSSSPMPAPCPRSPGPTTPGSRGRATPTTSPG